MTHVEAPPVEPLLQEDAVAREAMSIFKDYDEHYFKSLGALLTANGLRTPQQAAHRKSESTWNDIEVKKVKEQHLSHR